MRQVTRMLAQMERRYTSEVARQCLRIARENTPDSVTEYYPVNDEIGWASPYGMADPSDSARTIFSPKPTTPERLLVYLHECAHIVLGHVEYSGSPSQRARDEDSANAWALERMYPGQAIPRRRHYMRRSKTREVVYQFMAEHPLTG